MSIDMHVGRYAVDKPYRHATDTLLTLAHYSTVTQSELITVLYFLY